MPIVHGLYIILTRNRVGRRIHCFVRRGQSILDGQAKESRITQILRHAYGARISRFVSARMKNKNGRMSQPIRRGISRPVQINSG